MAITTTSQFYTIDYYLMYKGFRFLMASTIAALVSSTYAYNIISLK